VDHALTEEHRRVYVPRGRLMLAASVLVGWIDRRGDAAVRSRRGRDCSLFSLVVS
jgi:hypothetical protein